jgi:hypothetical protein
MCFTPVVPATQEAEAEGSHVPKSSRSAWATQWDLIKKKKNLTTCNYKRQPFRLKCILRKYTTAKVNTVEKVNIKYL